MVHRAPSIGSPRSVEIGRSPSARSVSPPSQTFHSEFLPRSVPTPALVESVASGAHYSGAHTDPLLHHRGNSKHRHSSTEVRADHQGVLSNLEELYCCRPTREIFDRSWRKDAIFEDPFTKCKGFDEYAAQWFAMPKIYSKSQTISIRVMSSTLSPNRLVYAQTQEYTYRFLGYKKKVDSIIVVDLDEDEKIVKLLDQWNGHEPPTRYGALFLRRANAKLIPWLVKVPKHLNGRSS